MWYFQHWQNGMIIWPPLSKLLHRSPKTETPSKLQVIKTKDKSNLSCLSYFLPGPRPRLAWDNFEKDFTLKTTCREPKVCFRIWNVDWVYVATANFCSFFDKVSAKQFCNQLNTYYIVSELYRQRLQIPWSPYEVIPIFAFFPCQFFAFCPI